MIAYQRKRLGDNKVIDIVSLDLPEQDFVTQALWYVIGDRMAAALPSEVLLGALHASEHGQIPVPAPATTRTGPAPSAAARDCSRPSFMTVWTGRCARGALAPCVRGRVG